MRGVDNRILVKVAHYYYQDNLTQEQIAKKMHMSRQKVNRLIKRLLKDGVVTIHIKEAVDFNIELEKELEAQFGLRQAIVVKVEEDELMNKLGAAASDYLSSVIQNDTTVGVAWGRAVHSVARHLTPANKSNVSVVQLVGGMTHANVSQHADEIFKLSAEIVSFFADKLDATPYLMYAPIFVETKQVRDSLIADQTIRNTLDRIRNCDVAVFGIGAVSEEVTPFKYGHLPLSELDKLQEMNCVGNLCFRYYNLSGSGQQTKLNERTIGPTLGDIKGIPLTVGVAGGVEKRDAITGALRGGYLNVLVVDEATAKAVLAIKKHNY